MAYIAADKTNVQIVFFFVFFFFLFFFYSSMKTHYENTSIQIYWKFHHQKMKIFR